MTTLIKTKRRNYPGNNNRKHGIYTKSLNAAAAQGVHRHDAEPALALIFLRLRANPCRDIVINRRSSIPAGTNLAKIPESAKKLTERIEAKTAPYPPIPASNRHKKMKHFLPFFHETNQLRSCRERLFHFDQDDWGTVAKESGVLRWLGGYGEYTCAQRVSGLTYGVNCHTQCTIMIFR